MKDIEKVKNELVRKLLLRYDPRKSKGPQGYGDMVDVEQWIKSDLADGHFIEAYAIADQYADTVLSLCFPEIFYSTYRNMGANIKIETFLRFAIGFNIIEKKFLDLYCDFKSTRNDLIHKSVFNQKKVSQFKNSKKINSLPFIFIRHVENIFHKRIPAVYSYFNKNLHKSISFEDEMFGDFILMWNRIWEKQGKNLLEFLNETAKLDKKL